MKDCKCNCSIFAIIIAAALFAYPAQISTYTALWIFGGIFLLIIIAGMSTDDWSLIFSGKPKNMDPVTWREITEDQRKSIRQKGSRITQREIDKLRKTIHHKPLSENEIEELRQSVYERYSK